MSNAHPASSRSEKRSNLSSEKLPWESVARHIGLIQAYTEIPPGTAERQEFFALYERELWAAQKTVLMLDKTWPEISSTKDFLAKVAENKQKFQQAQAIARYISFADIRAQKLGPSGNQGDSGVEQVLFVTRPMPARILKSLQVRLQRTPARGKRNAGYARVFISVNGRQAKLSQLIPKKQKLGVEIRVIQAA